jgi:hypothetical protein
MATKVKYMSDFIADLVDITFSIRKLTLERNRELEANHNNAAKSLLIQINQLSHKCKWVIQKIKEKLYGNSIFQITFTVDGEIHHGMIVAICKSEVIDLYKVVSQYWQQEIKILEIKEIHPFVSDHKSIFI